MDSIVLKRLALAMVTTTSLGAQAMPTYSVTVIPTVNAISAEGNAINDLGQVAGTLRDSSGVYRAFVWSAASGTQILPSFGSGSTFGLGINNAGQVVGGGTSENFRAFLWSASDGLTDLGATSGYPTFQTFGMAINDSGEVAGYKYGGGDRAILWDADGDATSLPLITSSAGSRIGSAYDINAAGQVVGQSGPDFQYPVLWSSDGGVSYLGSLPGLSAVGSAQGINDLGQVVGVTGSGTSHTAFIWDSANGMQALSGLGLYSEAREINNAGVVVGQVYTNADPGGFVWSATEGVWNLESLIDPADPYYGLVDLTAANAINEAGQIVGYGQYSTATRRINAAFVLTPVPEPESFALMLAGLGLLGTVMRRQRTGRAGRP